MKADATLCLEQFITSRRNHVAKSCCSNGRIKRCNLSSGLISPHRGTWAELHHIVTLHQENQSCGAGSIQGIPHWNSSPSAVLHTVVQHIVVEGQLKGSQVRKKMFFPSKQAVGSEIFYVMLIGCFSKASMIKVSKFVKKIENPALGRKQFKNSHRLQTRE